MTGGLVHPASLSMAFMAEGITLTGSAFLFFVAYWFSRGPTQQKVAILNACAAATAAVGLWVLFTNGFNWLRSDNVLSFWGRWLFYAGGFAALSASLDTTLIMHNWAKIVNMVAAVAMPLNAMAISLSASNGTQIVLIVYGLISFLFMAYLLLLNITRKDVLGYVLVFVQLALALAYGLVLLLGPEFLGANVAALHGFTYEIYAWVFFALAIVQFFLVPLVAWFFVEDERTYRQRKGLPVHEHLSTGDGTSLALLPSAAGNV